MPTAALCLQGPGSDPHLQESPCPPRAPGSEEERVSEDGCSADGQPAVSLHPKGVSQLVPCFALSVWETSNSCHLHNGGDFAALLSLCLQINAFRRKLKCQKKRDNRL